MPWVIKKTGDEWCVYAEGSDGEAEGDTLGCHDTEAGAKDQLAALYANVPEASRSDAPETKPYQPGMVRTGPIAPNREERTLVVPGLEVRVGGNGNPPQIVGYASVFNAPSQIMADWFGSGFREYITPGAFKKTLSDGADVRALVNHNPDYVLGRTKSGTLKLQEDSHGLRMEITPPDTRWAADLLTTMQRGDVDGASFGFYAVRERWGTGQTETGEEIDERFVLEAKLLDVSVVTFPAYPQTESQVRSLFEAAGLDVDALARAILRAQRGLRGEADSKILRSAIAYMQKFLPLEDATPAAPVQADHPAEASSVAPTHTSHPTAEQWRRLERLETLIKG